MRTARSVDRTFVARVLTWWRRRRHRAAVARAHGDRERLAARRRAMIASWSSSTSDGSRISTRPLTRAELEAPPDGEQSPRWIGDRRTTVA
jgi:hypothetical protein